MASPSPALALQTQNQLVNVIDVPNISGLVQADTSRLVFGSNRRRYTALSLLFFLPLTSSIMVMIQRLFYNYPTLDLSSCSIPFSSEYLATFGQFFLAFTAFVLVPAAFGISAVTYCVLCDSGACRRNATLTSAVKYVFSSSFRNFFCTIAAGIKGTSGEIFFMVSLVTMFRSFDELCLFRAGLQILIHSILNSCLLAPEWGLAAAVSLVGKTRWSEPLDRSLSLLKRSKRQKEAGKIFRDYMFKLVPIVILGWWMGQSSVVVMALGILWGSILWARMICYYVAANAFLYLYCTCKPRISKERCPPDQDQSACRTLKRIGWGRELVID